MAVAKADRQTAKFNSPPNFPAIRYIFHPPPPGHECHGDLPHRGCKRCSSGANILANNIVLGLYYASFNANPHPPPSGHEGGLICHRWDAKDAPWGANILANNPIRSIYGACNTQNSEYTKLKHHPLEDREMLKYPHSCPAFLEAAANTEHVLLIDGTFE